MMKVHHFGEEKTVAAEVSIDDLCQGWLDAKSAENTAKDQRLLIEAAICGLVDVPTEGTNTTTTGQYKCKTVGKLTRKLDPAIWAEIEQDIPEELRPVQVKLSLDIKKLKAIETANPAVWSKIAKAVTSTDAKPSISIEVLQ